MTAGFDWDAETFPYEDPRNDNHKPFESEHDPVAFILGLRAADQPGTVWKYNNGLTEVLAAIIEQKTGKRLDEYAIEALFEPMGINSRMGRYVELEPQGQAKRSGRFVHAAPGPGQQLLVIPEYHLVVTVFAGNYD